MSWPARHISRFIDCKPAELSAFDWQPRSRYLKPRNLRPREKKANIPMPASDVRVKVLAIGWLGVRTPQSAAMSAFFGEVLGMKPILPASTGSRFRLADGVEAHVYPEYDEDHQFFGSGPVVGFAVESFAVARAALVEAGIQFVYPEPQRADGRAWQHFRAPDGNVYEIIGPDDVDT